MQEIAAGAGHSQPRRLNSAMRIRQLAALLWQEKTLLIFGIRLWASVCLALYIAFWLQLDNPFWAGTSAAIVCMPSLGASLRKASYRMVGTVIGAVFIVALSAAFPPWYPSRDGFAELRLLCRSAGRLHSSDYCGG